MSHMYKGIHGRYEHILYNIRKKWDETANMKLDTVDASRSFKKNIYI